MTDGPPVPRDALLLDASVWLAALDSADRYHDDSRAVIRRRPTLALDLTPYEVANVAVRAWRDRDQADAMVELVMGSIAVPLVAVTASLAHEAIELAERHSITVYDAMYAAASLSLDRTLVSCDHRDLIDNGLAISPTTACAE